VTPAEAQEMLDGATPGPWAAEVVSAEDAAEGLLAEGDFVVVGDDGDVAHVPATLASPIARDARLLAAAPDLAATVAAEPTRLRPWQDAAADATTLWVWAETERDAALAHAEELTRALRIADRTHDATLAERDALRAAVREYLAAEVTVDTMRVQIARRALCALAAEVPA
jgi:hypothetical protein